MKILNIVVVAVSTLLLLPLAYAVPTTAAGSFTGSFTQPTVRTAGGNMILSSNVVFTITGTFNGKCAGPSTTIVHADGTTNSKGRCTFTGTIDDKSGTAVFLNIVQGKGSTFQGHFVILSGTGGLANVKAEGSFQGTQTGPASNMGTYSGHINFP